ncbi:MobV family relaxase [Bacteroides sp.]|uniref:MobV family relaxase n=1 Tax=Bacteroides sp. TaxID=29523 RepID=UPI00260DC802|nr:MobV family relaxase [Bacteroides sp.]
MGYAVLHMEKASASDSGMSAHIERTIAPKNADVERTHLNREMITFPDGVQNRTQAIQHRLDTAGLERKIGKNQVRAVRILLTGSPDDMRQIEQAGKLDEWCKDNLDWLKKTYGADNIVSAVLHLDETTPHIHATMVPIVTGERRRKKSEDRQGKKKYRTKSSDNTRLCADDVMSRIKLKEYQNTYAEQMAKFGLQRGIEGSEAKHITTSQYYRELLNQTESIQSNISVLLKQQEAAKAELSKAQADVSKEKLKNSAADVGSKLMDGVSSLLGTPKVAKMEMENRQLRVALQELWDENKAIKEGFSVAKKGAFDEIENQKMRLSLELRTIKESNEQREQNLKKENNNLKNTLSKVLAWFPTARELLKTESLCRAIGLTAEQIAILFKGTVLSFTGWLHSEEYKQKFKTENSKIHLCISEDKKRVGLVVDKIPIAEWFKLKYEELKLPVTKLHECVHRKGFKI